MPHSYDELERRFHRLTDGAAIFSMVRPLTLAEARERRARFGATGERTTADDHFYRCVLWDEETRRCSAYAERPAMCSGYPYASECFHCGWQLPDGERFVHAALAAGAGRWLWEGRPFAHGVAAITLPG